MIYNAPSICCCSGSLGHLLENRSKSLPAQILEGRRVCCVGGRQQLANSSWLCGRQRASSSCRGGCIKVGAGAGGHRRRPDRLPLLRDCSTKSCGRQPLLFVSVCRARRGSPPRGSVLFTESAVPSKPRPRIHRGSSSSSSSRCEFNQVI